LRRPDIENAKKILESANNPKQYYPNQGFYNTWMIKAVPELIEYIEQLEKDIKMFRFDTENFADYLLEDQIIKNASEAFEHQDRDLLISVLKRWG